MNYKYAVKHSENPKEYKRLQALERRRRHPIRYLLNQARCRAKKLGLDFDIEEKDLEVPEVCPVFGIPLFFKGGKRGPNSFSLDRWDNTKGYVKGNVRVISFKANQYKGDMSIEEVQNLLEYMKGIPHSLSHL